MLFRSMYENIRKTLFRILCIRKQCENLQKLKQCEKLGVSSDEQGIYLVPDGKSARTSVAADLEGNPYAKRFVEEGLGAYSPRTLTLTLTLTRSSAIALEIRSTLAHVPQLFRNVSYWYNTKTCVSYLLKF